MLILKRVLSMMGYSLPSNHQHGFQPQHGTDTATTTIFEFFNGLIETEKKVILVSLDMSAAFDLLDKYCLVPKLRARGFQERVIAIYYDYLGSHYLSDRKGVVQV
jgi:hypothetical protein